MPDSLGIWSKNGQETHAKPPAEYSMVLSAAGSGYTATALPDPRLCGVPLTPGLSHVLGVREQAGRSPNGFGTEKKS